MRLLFNSDIAILKTECQMLSRPKTNFCYSPPSFQSKNWFWLLFLAVSGCASYGEIKNTEIATIDEIGSYSLKEWRKNQDTGDINFVLNFSGGGTRAAAMSYGVLEELRDTNIQIDGASKRLLDEVDVINSVSGGSFTSAFYGLYGDKISDIFEEQFLRVDIDKSLVHSLLNPLHWFTSEGRTERTIEYYEETLFHGATFTSPVKDMDSTNRQPSILEAVSAMSGVQLHRYNTATLELMETQFGLWAEELSTPDHKVDVYFVQVAFKDINQPELKLLLNKIPTSFNLTDEEVDTLIKTSRSLLRENRIFQNLLTRLNNE